MDGTGFFQLALDIREREAGLCNKISEALRTIGDETDEFEPNKVVEFCEAAQEEILTGDEAPLPVMLDAGAHVFTEICSLSNEYADYHWTEAVNTALERTKYTRIVKKIQERANLERRRERYFSRQAEAKIIETLVRHGGAQDENIGQEIGARSVHVQEAQNQIQNQNVQEPVLYQNVQEPVQGQNVQEPVQDQNVQGQIQNQNVQEPVQYQNVQKQVQNRSVQEPVAFQNVEEPVQDQNVQEQVPIELEESVLRQNDTFRPSLLHYPSTPVQEVPGSSRHSAMFLQVPGVLPPGISQPPLLQRAEQSLAETALQVFEVTEELPRQREAANTPQVAPLTIANPDEIVLPQLQEDELVRCPRTRHRPVRDARTQIQGYTTRAMRLNERVQTGRVLVYPGPAQQVQSLSSSFLLHHPRFLHHVDRVQTRPLRQCSQQLTRLFTRHLVTEPDLENEEQRLAERRRRRMVPEVGEALEIQQSPAQVEVQREQSDQQQTPAREVIPHSGNRIEQGLQEPEQEPGTQIPPEQESQQARGVDVPELPLEQVEEAVVQNLVRTATEESILLEEFRRILEDGDPHIFESTRVELPRPEEERIQAVVPEIQETRPSAECCRQPKHPPPDPFYHSLVNIETRLQELWLTNNDEPLTLQDILQDRKDYSSKLLLLKGLDKLALNKKIRVILENSNILAVPFKQPYVSELQLAGVDTDFIF